jgi:hypothetical protein
VTPAAIAYLAVSSRHGPKPLNVHFLAASATGKTAALSAGMALHPETAFHDIGAGSARALIYDDEADFRHKTVIVAEADSIPDEGPAASAIRELAESNQMRYAVVERDEDTGKFHTRHIRKDGPTGLITTSTRPLEEQMQTRMLTVAINDSPDQTRLILAAQARAVAGEALPSPDLADFHALQTWLELAGVGEYVIPFAVALSEGIPAEFVRVRRDFPQLLAMIGAIATLYQCQRERDAHGRIVATLEDYSQARRLLINVFTETVTGGVSQAVRETATAVADLYDGETAVDMAALVEALKLHRATAWRRVRTALRLGYLVNEETRRGQPAKLRPGAALPEDRPALPEVDEIGECLNHPETDATVQPNGDGPIWPVSSEPVASPVQRGATAQHAAVASVVQPGIRADLDTKPAINGSAVARLHAKPEGIATPLCIVCGSPDVDGYAVDGTPGCYSHHVKETDSPLVAQAVGLGARIASRTAVTA